MLPWKYQELLKARDSRGDVGRSRKFDLSTKRNTRDVLVSNLKRAQESARVLEEFSGLGSARASGAFKKLRFELYDFEKDIIK
jgi:thiamine-phosphate pyrophosphorylase